MSSIVIIGESVTVKRGVYENVSGIVTSIVNDEYGTSIVLRVVSDPDGLFSAGDMQNTHRWFLNVSPSDL